MFSLLADISSLASADHVATGLESGPIRYVAALSLVANAVQFVLLYRNLRGEADRAMRLGEIIQQHNQQAAILDRAMVLLTSKKRYGSVPTLGPEPITASGRPPK